MLTNRKSLLVGFLSPSMRVWWIETYRKSKLIPRTPQRQIVWVVNVKCFQMYCQSWVSSYQWNVFWYSLSVGKHHLLSPPKRKFVKAGNSSEKSSWFFWFPLAHGICAGSADLGKTFLVHLQSFLFVLLRFSTHSFKAKLPLACYVNMCESLLIFMSIYIKSNAFIVALLFYFCARLIENSL